MILKKRHISDVLSEPDINFRQLTLNSALTWEIIKDNPDKPWDYNLICSNIRITNDVLKDSKCDWQSLSWNSSITSKMFEENLDKPWNYSLLSNNKNVPVSFIETNIDKPWRWNAVSANNSKLTWDFILRHPEIPWIYNQIVTQNYITWSIIKDNLDKFTDWHMISKNPNINLDIINANTEKPWDMKYINLINNLKNINYNVPWIFKSKYTNPDIFEIPFKKIRQYFAIKTIWRYWFIANTDPAYLICRRRLLKEYKNLN